MSAAKKYFNYLDLSSLKLWRIKFKSSKRHIIVMMPASCVIIYVNFDFCDFKCVHLFKTAIHGIDVDIWVLVKGSRQKMFSKAARGKNRFLLFRFCQTFIDNCCCCMCSFCPATQQPMEIEWKKLELKESNLWTVWPILSGNRGGNLTPKRKQIVIMIDVDFQCCCKYIMSFQFCRE